MRVARKLLIMSIIAMLVVAGLKHLAGKLADWLDEEWVT